MKIRDIDKIFDEYGHFFIDEYNNISVHHNKSEKKMGSVDWDTRSEITEKYTGSAVYEQNVTYITARK